MDIKLYNTLSRSKETFTPIKKQHVSIYNCGPTVYDTPHLGNYRTYVMADLLRRIFEYNDYKVTQVMNITDVDDKTIRRSREEKIGLKDLTLKYEKLFLLGLQALHIETPHHVLRAVDNIPAMIDLVEKLISQGTAYKAQDGVYLSIDKVNNYGALAQLDLSTKSKARIANDEYDKDNARDFALWKFATPDDGNVSWKAPFGEGRPGWHIECSAMSMKVLGPTIDIHTGGTDLIFPHHTNEIAQSECATGKPFVKYWVHGGFMNVSDEKMAKSKKNFIKLEDLIDNGVSPVAFRYWLLTAHYHSLLNFTYESVKAAQTALIKMMTLVASYPDGGLCNKDYRIKFQSLINDDLDMPKAVALAWELLKDAKVSPADKRATMLDFDRVFALDLKNAPRPSEEVIPPEILALASAREDARKAKEWDKADALRKEIDARGYDVNDTPNGPSVVRQ